MDTVATLPVSERAALFQETANRRGLSSQVIEKDFWVCWTLKQLFDLPDIGQYLIFKGGTSLSKIFQAIERFSEDIDISINREYLGFSGENDPKQITGTRARKRSLEALQVAYKEKVESDLLPALESSFANVLGEQGKKGDNFWQLVFDDTDLKNVVLQFTYPRDRSAQGIGEIEYIKPIVKIEIGSFSDHWPAKEYSIASYAADEFPDYFKAPSYSLKVLEAERTFWEKATILHAEYYRSEEHVSAHRISRHYYDLYKLDKTQVKEKALKNLDILKEVVAHKKVFYTRASAKYDEAATGAIRLTPSETRVRELKNDYEKMKDMFFGEVPPFEEIISSLEALQARINSMVSESLAPKQ